MYSRRSGASQMPRSRHCVLSIIDQCNLTAAYDGAAKEFLQLIKQVNTKAWYKALKRAGIEDFRWYDLRYNWASWLTQNGVPLNIIQEIGAWEFAEMVRRYAHLAPEQFALHVRVLDDMLNGKNLAQSE